MRLHPTLRTALTGLLAGLAALAPAALAPAAPSAAAPACTPSATVTCPAPPADDVLSNETTFTTWAYAVVTSPVRRDPSTSSPRITNLHLSTEDGFPEVYIVLRQRLVGSRTWAQVRVPAKPTPPTGWVPRGALDDFNRVTTELVLNRTTEQLHLYRSGHLVLTVPAGVGAPGTPTPAGHFWLREGFPVRGVGAYGPYAFGTSAYASLTDWPGGGVVGLHGTDEPQLVPGRPSHGCVRLRNGDIVRLARMVRSAPPCSSSRASAGGPGVLGGGGAAAAAGAEERRRRRDHADAGGRVGRPPGPVPGAPARRPAPQAEVTSWRST